MIEVVIIGRNEGEFVQKMYSSLVCFLPNAKRHWVVDRSNDDTAKQLKRLKEDYKKTYYLTVGFGRKTCTCRNIGLSMCSKESDVLFLDGDRYPLGDLSGLEKAKHDISLLFIENDVRNENIPYYKYYGNVNNNFYSCGIFIKRKAINKIIDFQKELFCEKVQKYWGCEDLYLGDVCYHLGITCDYFLDARLHGKFEKTKYDNLDIVRKRFELRDKLKVKWGNSKKNSIL